MDAVIVLVSQIRNLGMELFEGLVNDHTLKFGAIILKKTLNSDYFSNSHQGD